MFDTVGVFIVIVLTALFGYLTTRAWKLKNVILKWGGVVIAGLLTLISTALLVLALIGFYKLNERFDNPVANVRVAGTAAQIARGQQLAHICTNCHTKDGQLPLSGTDMAAKFPFPPLGTLYAPNLTPPPATSPPGPMARSFARSERGCTRMAAHCSLCRRRLSGI